MSRRDAPAFAEVAPPPELRPWLARLWVHRLLGPPPADGRRLLPDGRIDLVWIAGFGVRISGPHSVYTSPPTAGRIVALGATFHPGAAVQLLRTPAADLVDRHVALDAVDAGLAQRLDARLGDAVDAGEALTAFASELARALRGASAPDVAVREAVRRLDSSRATVSAAAGDVFVSDRELRRRFGDHIGYGPKTLHRVLRFQRLLRLLEPPRANLARAATIAGYADQAHLSREARRIAGLTPRRLVTWTH